MADESPLRHSRPFCTRWNGLDKASGVMEALDDKEFSGSLEMSDIPERAALECIVNDLGGELAAYGEIYRVRIRPIC